MGGERRKIRPQSRLSGISRTTSSGIPSSRYGKRWVGHLDRSRCLLAGAAAQTYELSTSRMDEKDEEIRAESFFSASAAPQKYQLPSSAPTPQATPPPLVDKNQAGAKKKGNFVRTSRVLDYFVLSPALCPFQASPTTVRHGRPPPTRKPSSFQNRFYIRSTSKTKLCNTGISKRVQTKRHVRGACVMNQSTHSKWP